MIQMNGRILFDDYSCYYLVLTAWDKSLSCFKPSFQGIHTVISVVQQPSEICTVQSIILIVLKTYVLTIRLKVVTDNHFNATALRE